MLPHSVMPRCLGVGWGRGEVTSRRARREPSLKEPLIWFFILQIALSVMKSAHAGLYNYQQQNQLEKSTVAFLFTWSYAFDSDVFIFLVHFTSFLSNIKLGPACWWDLCWFPQPYFQASRCGCFVRAHSSDSI